MERRGARLRSRIGKTVVARGEEFITCEEVITFLSEYVARELDPDEALNFERHLARCPSCVAYLATYRQTILLCREVWWEELPGAPPELESELVRAILAARPA